MKQIYLLMMALCILIPTSIMAQKAEQLQNSYYFKRATEILQNNGDQNEALEYLYKEVAEHPKNGYAYLMIGSLYNNADMAGDAIEPTNKAIKYLQKDKEWITYAYRQRAEINLKLGNEAAALNDWTVSLKANPKDVNTLSDRAEFYYQKNMYAESDADFDRICKLEPGNTLGYWGKGRNALEKQKYKDAEELFSYSIKLDPSHSLSYAYRAESYFYQDKINNAIDDILTALEINNNNMAYNLMLLVGEPEVKTLIAKLKVKQLKNSGEGRWSYYIGNVYETMKNYLKAIDNYKESVKIEPIDRAYSRIAGCYSELGDFDLAVENINMAIELEPNDDSYVGMKADMLYDMGKGKEAIAAYDDYIKANPEFWGGYYRRGFLKDNLKDTNGAIEDYSTAITLKPDYAYSYLGRADMYLKQENKEAAMNDYRMVIELDSVLNENNCAQYAYVGLGEYEKAKQFEYAILANSPSAGNYYDAACVFARMGEKETSLNFLKSALEKGFSRFAHIKTDDDLDIIRDLQGYKELITEYETKFKEEQRQKKEGDRLPEKKEVHTTEIPFTWNGGNCYVKCEINDLPMQFVFDTGASNVSISMVEASFMMKNGYLSQKDVIGSASFSDANGNVNEGTIINLRKVQLGNLKLENVRASVVRNQIAPLLLGQTVLSRAGKIEIDNKKKVIKVTYME